VKVYVSVPIHLLKLLIYLSPFTTTLWNIFGGPPYFRRPEAGRRKYHLIFGGLTQPPKKPIFGGH
jgi:hypothetical protein